MPNRITRHVPQQAASGAIRIAALLALVSVGTAEAARAQEVAVTPHRKSFTGVVGIGVVALPRYAGSDDHRVLPIPIVELEYRGRAYLGSSPSGMSPGIGAYLVRTPAFSWDVGLSGAEARPESRGNALAGMGRRSLASFASTGVAYRYSVVKATAGVAVGLGGDAGAYGTVGLASELPLARRWVAGVSTSATFADARNMSFDFGVTSEQSAARRSLHDAGDPRLRGIDVAAYAPGAGLKETRGGASLAYLLAERSRVVVFTQGTSLSGSAARSPLVRKRDGTMTGIAIGYGF